MKSNREYTVTLFEQFYIQLPVNLTLFDLVHPICPQNRFFMNMRIIFAVLISWCKADQAAPRCYRCYKYAMMRGQDFIKKDKNDDDCDRLTSETEIVEVRTGIIF